jgi:hypothetical protein
MLFGGPAGSLKTETLLVDAALEYDNRFAAEYMNRRGGKE